MKKPEKSKHNLIDRLDSKRMQFWHLIVGIIIALVSIFNGCENYINNRNSFKNSNHKIINNLLPANNSSREDIECLIHIDSATIK